MARTRRQHVRTNKRWNAEEDARLLRHVRATPQNLHHCFLMVSQELTEEWEATGNGCPRTPTAVAAHWYSVLSKQDNICFFTASPKHVSKNRKNGMGVESSNALWRGLMGLLRRFHIL